MKLYRVVDWALHYENNKSRTRSSCSYVCVPNKQDGLGLTRILMEKDGLSIYGVWCLIIGMCSRQKARNGFYREGWLTEDGSFEGVILTPSDLALRWRRSESEVARALKVLTSPKVGWISTSEVTDVDGLDEESAPVVPGLCPPGAQKRSEEKEGIEPLHPPVSRKRALRPERQALMLRLGGLFRRRPGTSWSLKEQKSLDEIGIIEEEELKLIEAYYHGKQVGDKDIRRRDLHTLLNNWPGEVDRARTITQSRDFRRAHTPEASEPKPEPKWMEILNNLNGDMDFAERKTSGGAARLTCYQRIKSLPDEAWEFCEQAQRRRMKNFIENFDPLAD